MSGLHKWLQSMGFRASPTQNGRVTISPEDNASDAPPDVDDDIGFTEEEASLDAFIRGADLKTIPKLNILVMIVGSRGDVQPFVSLGKKLVSMGHRVRLATHLTFSSFVQSNGLEFYPISADPKELMAYMVRHPGLLPSDLSEVTRKRKVMKEIVESCWVAAMDPEIYIDMEESSPPQPAQKDAFVCNAIISNPATFAHIHIAEKLCVPLHIFFTMPWSATRSFPHPLANLDYQKHTAAHSPTLNYMTYSMVDALTWTGLADIVNDWRDETLGLEPLRGTAGRAVLKQLAVPHAYCWSPHLIPKPSDWGTHIDITGFFFLDQTHDFKPDPELEEFLSKGPKPIYVGFGSIVVDNPEEFTQTIMDAFKETGYRGIISQGWAGIGGDKSSLPENVFLIGNCPHDWLFPQCSAVCHHGGAGTTAAGLRAGKPTIIVPFFGDQPFWGQMVHDIGAGPLPLTKQKFSKETLIDALRYVQDDDVQESARKLGLKMSEEDGVSVGAQVFAKQLPIKSMVCDIFPDRLATIFCYECNLKLCRVAHQALHGEKTTKFTTPHTCYKYAAVDWRLIPPTISTGLEQGVTSFVGASCKGVKELVQKPYHGGKEGGITGAMKGLGEGLKDAVTGPVVGTKALGKKVYQSCSTDKITNPNTPRWAMAKKSGLVWAKKYRLIKNKEEYEWRKISQLDPVYHTPSPIDHFCGTVSPEDVQLAYSSFDKRQSV